MTAVLILIAFPVVLALFAIWRGFALSLIWDWVMVAHFDAPAISIPLAISISVLVHLLTSSKTGEEATDESKRYMPFVLGLVGPLIAIVIVWIALKFV